MYIHTLNYTSTCTHLKQKKTHSQNLHKDRNYEISNCSARIRLDDTVLVYFPCFIQSVLSMLHLVSEHPYGTCTIICTDFLYCLWPFTAKNTD